MHAAYLSYNLHRTAFTIQHYDTFNTGTYVDLNGAIAGSASHSITTNTLRYNTIDFCNLIFFLILTTEFDWAIKRVENESQLKTSLRNSPKSYHDKRSVDCIW